MMAVASSPGTVAGPRLAVQRRAALPAFLIAAAASGLAVWASEDQAIGYERSRAGHIAETYASAIQSTVERALSSTYPLAALVRESGGNAEAFEALAVELLPYYPGASALQLAPGGVVRRIVPLQGNEGAVGHDLLKDPTRDKEAFRARDTGTLTLAGPFNLVQGGLGAVGRLPVFLGVHGDRKAFWGFVSVVIRLPEVLVAADLKQLGSNGYAYELSRIHPDTGRHHSIATAGGTLKHPVDVTLDVPNATWTLSVAPLAGWTDPARLALKCTLGLLFSLLVAALGHSVDRLRRQKLDLEQRVEARTRELAVSEQRFRLLTERAHDVIYSRRVDPPRFDYVSPSVEDVTGYTPQELCDDPALAVKLVHPGDRAVVDSLLDRDDVHTVHLRWVRRDGQVIWTEQINRPVTDSGGRVIAWEGIARDITERKRIEDSLRLSEQRFSDIAHISADWIWEVDAQARYTYASENVLSLLGYRPDELLGKSPFDLMAPDEASRVAEAFGKIVATKSAFHDLENVVLGKDGRAHVTLTSGTPFLGAAGELLGYRGVDRDITRQRQLEERVRQLAYVDSLTQLPNRRVLVDRLNQAMVASRRNGTWGVLMFLDLDNFKPLNDLHGHAVGDLLLVEVARRLKRCVRETDSLARFGGDEFVVLLGPMYADPEKSRAQAVIVAEKILAALSEPYRLVKPAGASFGAMIQHRCTASIGVAMFQGTGVSQEPIMRSADAAMYAAKASGRNTIRFADPIEPV